MESDIEHMWRTGHHSALPLLDLVQEVPGPRSKEAWAELVRRERAWQASGERVTELEGGKTKLDVLIDDARSEIRRMAGASGCLDLDRIEQLRAKVEELEEELLVVKTERYEALGRVAELDCEADEIVSMATLLAGTVPKSAKDAMQGAIDCARQLAKGESEWRILAEELQAQLDRSTSDNAEFVAEQAARLAGEQPNPRSMESGYWASDDDGVELYDTAREAEAHAKASIAYCRGRCDPAWPEDVEHIRWGVVLGQSVEHVLDDEPPEGCDYMADYVLKPP